MRLVPWRTVIPVGVVIVLVGLLLGLTDVTRPVVALVSAYVISEHARSKRSMAYGPWRLIGWAAVLVAIGAVVRSGYEVLGSDGQPPLGPASIVELGAYGLMIAGALRLAMARTQERRREDSTDAMIVAAAAGMVIVNVVLSAYLYDTATARSEQLVTLGYTACALVLVGLMAKVAFGPGARNGSYRLLAISTLAMVLAAVLFGGAVAGWEWSTEAGSAVVSLGLAAAAAASAHPGAAELSAKPTHEGRRTGNSRLGLLAAALLVGPVMLVASEFGADRIDRVGTMCGAALLAMLVLLRMADLVRSKELTSERERGLRDAATQLATATDRKAVLRAAVDGALEITGALADSRASVYAIQGGDLNLVHSRGHQRGEVMDHVGGKALEMAGVSLTSTAISAFEAVRPVDTDTAVDANVAVVPLGSNQPERFVAVVTQLQGRFTEDQLASLQSFGSQVSMALEGVSLREHMHKRRSNRRFRALVENSSDVVLVLDKEGRVSFASPTVRRLLGREEADLVGASVEDLVHESDRLQARRLVVTAAKSGSHHHPVELRLLHGGGEVRWFEVEARDLRAEAEVKGIVITASDIGDRKRAEAELVRSEARFRLMVQNSSDVVAIVGQNGRLTYVSPSVERLLGYSSHEVLDRNVYELLSVTEAERVRPLRVKELDGSTIEVRIQGGDGRVRAVEVAVADMRRQPEVDGVVLNIRDVTERKSLEDDLRYQALHDDLTGLANRASFADRVQAAATAAAGADAKVGVLVVDLDDFKVINDSLGHVVGDEVLRQVSSRIQDCLDDHQSAARIGGDEFAVLLERIDGAHGAAEVSEHLHKALAEPLRVGENEFRLAASIGIVIGDDKSRTGEDLLRAADLAVHEAKQAGKNRHEFFDERMEESILEELEIKNALQRALDNDEFVLHYQPIIDLATSEIRGIEALIRWEDPHRGMVSPGAFIPVAEDTGLIRPIGLWVIEQAARDLAAWRAMGLDLYCSVNVSGRQLDEEQFAERFMGKVRDSGVDPGAIVVELTESVLAAQGVSEVFDRFHEEGYRLALDDFGTGYSAFQYLQTFNIDIIKIDRSFVQAMNTEDDAGVVEAVLDVARRIDAQTVAEGIEEAEELSRLTDLGVELGQGYYFARPMPASDLQELLGVGDVDLTEDAPELGAAWPGDRAGR